LKIRFQADADLDPAIGWGILRRENRLDWRAAQGFIPDATPDAEVLRLASAADRVLVTADVTTMSRHFATFVNANRSPGVILVPPATSIGLAIERLLEAWLLWDAEDLENQIRWLP
jgi:predicted nuclease of predicted toxin-antitoxin system